jgi:hypothetical protein
MMRYQTGIERRYGGGATPEETDAEFAARVESVGPEPGFLNGRVAPFQRLDVTVTEVRRGDGVAVGDYLPLDVFIAAGEPHIGVGEFDLPALDSSMVQPGVLVVAWANRSEQGWEAVQISTDGPSGAGGNLYAGRGYRY